MVPGITALVVAFSSLVSFVAPQPPPVVERAHAVCAAPSDSNAACLAKVYGHSDGKVAPAAKAAGLPAGFGPAQLRSAYQIPTSTGGRVAVIGAYDNPNAK